VLDGKIYVAGGRPPRGSDFAVYDPKADKWQILPDLPSQRNHIAGANLFGRIHVVGGRLLGGFQSDQTTAHEVYDPKTNSWTQAAPMLRSRSGMNSTIAHGCFHVWGGEYKDLVFPDHDYYDARIDKWTRLADMPTPVHGVTGSAFVDGLIRITGGGLKTGGSSGSTLNQVYNPAARCQ
jgi:hypothetical protein